MAPWHGLEAMNGWSDLLGKDLQCLHRQVAGSDWKLVEEGKGTGGDAPGAQEPQFSTWDDVVGRKHSRSQQQQPSGTGAPGSAPGGREAVSTYYRWSSASMQAQVKAAT